MTPHQADKICDAIDTTADVLKGAVHAHLAGRLRPYVLRVAASLMTGLRMPKFAR